jgi:hypothetical protein
MRWAGHVTHERELHAGFWLGDLKERDHLKDLGVNGRIMYLKETEWEW